jgi:hypothetical protein
MPLKIGVGRKWTFVIYKLVEGLTLGCLNFLGVSCICLRVGFHVGESYFDIKLVNLKIKMWN